MAQQNSDAGTNTEESDEETVRTSIERNGRYEELIIEGVPEQSVAIDYGCTPPELIVHDAGARWIKSHDPNMPDHIIELPKDEK